MITETGHAHHTPDRHDLDPTEPTHESIVRARAAQQVERLAFTEITGVPVNRNGKMMIQKGYQRTHPTIC